jgi:glyoxylase-like metal-dependent hydrolase (beta-lactamase superfamily II)
VVEFADYITVIEAPLSEERSLAVIAEAKRLVPSKPIKYLLTTHHHFDHTGGLRTYVAEGATIITQANNREFLERALNTPRTLLDDVLAKNPKRAKVETVDEKRVYTDGTRTVEFYHIYPAPHSNGLMIAYLPKEKVLFQGDFSVIPDESANDHVRALVPALEKLGLMDFDRYINVHVSAAPQHKADVLAAMRR